MEYGLIGEKLGHSYSREVHKLLGNKNYKLTELEEDELLGFMMDADFKGINVTIPYKEKVMPYLKADAIATKIGCVNTVVNRNGNVKGYNTDLLGMKYMLGRAQISTEGKRVLILGTGGAARTAYYVCKRGGAKEIRFVSRSGKTSIDENALVTDYQHLSIAKDTEILINTTPVGMFPDWDLSLVALKDFKKLEAVVDVIYNPLRTKLILDAKERGLKTASGISMLVAQAYYANRLFKEEVDVKTLLEEMTYPMEDIEKLISKLLDDKRNIIFIGMPGSGKTTVAKAVAEKLGKKFFDSDEELNKKIGMTPGRYILKNGEAKFREEETEILKKLLSKSGNVIATGGGAILSKENQYLLSQNGLMIFLERELECLEKDGRPLSQGEDAVKKLYENRHEIYLNLSDIVIPVPEGDMEGEVEMILQNVKENSNGGI